MTPENRKLFNDLPEYVPTHDLVICLRWAHPLSDGSIRWDVSLVHDLKRLDFLYITGEDAALPTSDSILEWVRALCLDEAQHKDVTAYLDRYDPDGLDPEGGSAAYSQAVSLAKVVRQFLGDGYAEFLEKGVSPPALTRSAAFTM